MPIIKSTALLHVDQLYVNIFLSDSKSMCLLDHESP